MKIRGVRIGYHADGRDWRWKFEKLNYHTCIYLTFWRFYIAWDKPLKKVPHA